MHILVTNDDGVFAPGLLALAEAMQPLGKITILAPDHNWSVSGHVKTLNRPLRVKDVKLSNGMDALATDGAPSDCVALAALGLLDEPVDLVVSGINPFANLGHDLTYSGTVTAAMEGAIWKLPSVAFSLDGGEEAVLDGQDYGPAGMVARQVVELVVKNDLPRYVLLNVNVPALPVDQIKGFQITRQGLRIYRDRLVKRVDPSGRPYYWIGGQAPTGVRENGTDIGALADGYVSITPVQLDLTSYEMLHVVSEWSWPETVLE